MDVTKEHLEREILPDLRTNATLHNFLTYWHHYITSISRERKK